MCLFDLETLFPSTFPSDTGASSCSHTYKCYIKLVRLYTIYIDKI